MSAAEGAPARTWSAPVRYFEVDQQGVVFNAHYLVYCDEAMAAFCDQRGLLGFAEDVRLVASSQTWTSSARWGDVIDVTARCEHVGRTSLRMHFAVYASGRACCTVVTSYVYTNQAADPLPITDEVRQALLTG